MHSRLRLVLLSFTLCLAFGLIAPALASAQLDVRIDPIQPLIGDDFVIVVEGTADSALINIEEVVREDQEIEVRLQSPPCVITPCAPQPFRFDIPIDGSSDPFNEGGLVILHINLRVGNATDRETLVWTRFAIGNVFFHSMQPNAILAPRSPTDNDRVELFVPAQADACGPSPPELERVERAGSSLSVFMRFSPGFGGGFLTETFDDTKCTPPGPYLGLGRADLGMLEPGPYTLELYFQSDFRDSLPVRVARRNFEVTDAPDVVALQDERFLVALAWRDFDGNSGVGKPVPGPTPDSTLFTFFGTDNWEVLVKVLDGCALNDHFWVFAAAATDVEYTLTVTDTFTGTVRNYSNPLGTASPAINDTGAFDTCPAPTN
ncbi:MAG: hypothetical protein AAGC60_18215 [Acidobacteriota bacterium]